MHIVNSEYRFVKFFVTDNESEYVLCAGYSDYGTLDEDDAGEFAAKILKSLKFVLNSKYKLFLKALYTDEDLEADSALDKLHDIFSAIVDDIKAEEEDEDMISDLDLEKWLSEDDEDDEDDDDIFGDD